MRATAFALVLMALAGLVPADLAAQATGPIKIGFISPLSGAIAAAGKDMYSGRSGSSGVSSVPPLLRWP